MNDDDFRLYRGPGWLGVITTSVLTSCGVLVAFLWAVQQGFLLVPLLDQKRPATSTTGSSPSSTAAHVSVPSLLGLATGTARELLSARGLRLVLRQKRPSPAPADTVIAQDPLADSMLPRDSQVVVVLSSGASATSSVPKLVGKPLPDALKELESAGLKAEEQGEGAGSDRTVTGSEPAAGKVVEKGSTVKLMLAPAGIQLPKLTGMRLTKAKKTIADLGLTLGKVRTRYDEEIDAYVILNQTPAPGTSVAPGSSVELVYSEE